MTLERVIVFFGNGLTVRNVPILAQLPRARMCTYAKISCMQPTDRELLEQTYKIERENNKMLRTMRRNSFVGGIFRLIWYALLLGVPLYAYLTYLQPVINSMLNTAHQVQGTSAQVQLQIEQMQSALQKIPGYSYFTQQKPVANP